MKYLNITIISCFLLFGTAFAQPDFKRPMPEEIVQTSKQNPAERFKQMPNRPSPEEFERRLNLTEEQKFFAKEQREKSIEKIKPILNEINNKKSEIEKLKSQNGSFEMITKKENEIQELRKQAHEIRKANMKAFEATLSESQLKELKLMKSEGRKEFEKHHKQILINKDGTRR